MNEMEESCKTLKAHVDNIWIAFEEALTKVYEEQKEKNNEKRKRCTQLRFAMTQLQKTLAASLEFGDDSTVVVNNTKGYEEFEKCCKYITQEFENSEIERLTATVEQAVIVFKNLSTIALVKTTQGHLQQNLPSFVDFFSFDVKAIFQKCFNGKMDSDLETCNFTGVTVLSNNRIVAVDHSNRKLKVFTSEGRQLSQVKLPHAVWDICIVKDGIIAASGCEDKKISTLKFEDDNLSLQETIDVDCQPFGIAFHDESYVVTCAETNPIRRYSNDGQLQSQSEGKARMKHLLKLPKSGKFVASKDETRWRDGLLYMFPCAASDERQILLKLETTVNYFRNKPRTSLTEGSIQGARGITVDENDNSFYCARKSSHIGIVSMDMQSKILLSESDGIHHPCAIALHKNVLVISEEDSDELKCFILY